MGRKIFVSYKYADSRVQRLNSKKIWESTTVRDYVDLLQTYFDSTTHINKGESDNEDLSNLSEDTIWGKLKDRIFDSSTTIIMISPGMKEPYRTERSQWIPWEVSFSLKETTRNDKTSRSNAMLAIVLPDIYGKYDYYFTVGECGVTSHNIDFLFPIIAKNMFNKKYPTENYCSNCKRNHYYGDYSYIMAVRWEDFIKLPEYYISSAHTRKDNIDEYDITKNL